MMDRFNADRNKAEVEGRDRGTAAQRGRTVRWMPGNGDAGVFGGNGDGAGREDSEDEVRTAAGAKNMRCIIAGS